MTKCRHLRANLCLLALVSLSGCALLPGGGGEPKRLSGLLSAGDSGWMLAPCDRSGELEVFPTNTLQTTFRTVAQPGQTAIFVELDGRVHDGTLRPTRLIRMQSTGRGCDAPTDPLAQWIAAGPHPSWRLTIGPQGIEFDSEAAERAGPSPVVAEQLPDGARSFRTQRDDRLELWLYPQDCFNHAGDFAHMSATLMVDGKRMSGCAYEGRAQSAR